MARSLLDDADYAYVFVSYSHDDSEDVDRVIKQLHDLNYRVWYDNGIRAGAIWTQEIATAIRECSSFLVCLSRTALESEYVLDEIHLALDAKKPVVVVHMHPLALPDGLLLRLGRRQALLRYELVPNQFEEKLLAALPPDARASLSVLDGTADTPARAERTTNRGKEGSDSSCRRCNAERHGAMICPACGWLRTTELRQASGALLVCPGLGALAHYYLPYAWLRGTVVVICLLLSLLMLAYAGDELAKAIRVLVRERYGAGRRSELAAPCWRCGRPPGTDWTCQACAAVVPGWVGRMLGFGVVCALTMYFAYARMAPSGARTFLLWFGWYGLGGPLSAFYYMWATTRQRRLAPWAMSGALICYSLAALGLQLEVVPRIETSWLQTVALLHAAALTGLGPAVFSLHAVCAGMAHRMVATGRSRNTRAVIGCGWVVLQLAALRVGYPRADSAIAHELWNWVLVSSFGLTALVMIWILLGDGGYWFVRVTDDRRHDLGPLALGAGTFVLAHYSGALRLSPYSILALQAGLAGVATMLLVESVSCLVNGKPALRRMLSQHFETSEAWQPGVPRGDDRKKARRFDRGFEDRT